MDFQLLCLAPPSGASRTVRAAPPPCVRLFQASLSPLGSISGCKQSSEARLALGRYATGCPRTCGFPSLGTSTRFPAIRSSGRIVVGADGAEERRHTFPCDFQAEYLLSRPKRSSDPRKMKENEGKPSIPQVPRSLTPQENHSLGPR